MEKFGIGRVTAYADETSIEGFLYAKYNDGVFLFTVTVNNPPRPNSTTITTTDYAVLGPNNDGMVWFTIKDKTYYFNAPLVCKRPVDDSKKEIDNSEQNQ